MEWRSFKEKLDGLDVPCLAGGDPFREKVRIRVLNIILYKAGKYELRDAILGDAGVFAPRFEDPADADAEARVLAAQLELAGEPCQECHMSVAPPACWSFIAASLLEDSG